MSVIETRAKVSIIDGATSNLNSISRSIDTMNASLTRGGVAAKGFSVNMNALTSSSGAAKSIGAVSKNFDQAANSVSNMNKMINRLTYSVMRYTVIYEGIQKLGDLWSTVVGGAYDYGNMIETNRIGMAGILSSMLQINGQQLTWNQSLQVSSKIMQDLQNESLKTSATAGELIDTFRALLGPGLSAGMSLEQIEHFTTVGVNAVKSLGLDGVQLVQELRDLVQGGIRPASSTLATSLGITDADIKKAKASSEGLYKFLMDRMKGFEYSALETNNTVKGRLDQIKEGLQRGIADGTAPLRGVYSEALKNLGNSLIQVNKETKEWKINPEFVSTLDSVSSTMVDLGTQAKDVGEAILPWAKGIGGTVATAFGQLSSHLGMIAAVWGTMKISKVAKDFLQILTVSREEREIQTSIGKLFQGLNDKVSGYAEKQKRALEIQKEKEAWQAEENKLIDQAILSYDKMVSGISKGAEEARTLNEIVQSNENSVVNLAKKWQTMGMGVKEAISLQNEIVNLMSGGFTTAAMVKIGQGDNRAHQIQSEIEALKAQEKQQQHTIALYKQQKKAIDDVVASEHERQMQVKNTAKDELNEISLLAKKINARGDKTEKARFNVDSFLSVDTSNGPAKTKKGTVYIWQQEQVSKLRDMLQQLKLDESVVQQTTEQFMNSIKAGMSNKVIPVFDQAVNSALVWQKTIDASLGKAARMSNEQINYEKFMASGLLGNTLGEENASKLKGYAAITLEETSEKLKKVGMSAEEARQKAFEFTNQFIQGLQAIDAANPISVANLMKQVSDSAATYAQNFKLVKEQTEAVAQANADAALQFDALANAFKIGGEEAYQATKKLVEESKALQAALNERGAAEQANAVYKEMVDYLNQVANAKDKATLATKEEMKATEESTEALKNHTKAQEENNGMVLTGTEKLSKHLGIVSIASMNISILTDMVAANSDENKEWASAIADSAMQISMVAMGIEGLISIFPDLIKGLKAATAAFKELGIVKSAVALAAANPITALGLLGVGAVAYGVASRKSLADTGDTDPHSYFSGAELGEGMSGDDLFSYDASQYQTSKPGPSQSEADAADMATFGTTAYEKMDSKWFKETQKAAEEIEKNAKLIPEIANQAQSSSSGGGSGGGKSAKEELPELEYTDALGNAFWYMQHGYSVYAAAALAGNQMQEAGRGDTEAIDYDSVNRLGYSGMVQWGGDRLAKLKSFYGDAWVDKNNQLEYSDYELSQDPYYKTIGDRLKAANSLEEANRIVFSEYEAPGDDTEGTRLSYAQQLLPRLLMLKNKEATLNGQNGGGNDADRKREQLLKEWMDATKITIADTKNLSKETLSVTGKQSAYDRTIQEANDKLDEYRQQIERDKKLHVDEGVIKNLQSAMKDYAAAMKQKAIEAQQTETIDRYNDRISAIQNRNLGVGEIGQQRTDLLNEYTDMRDYLQEQLQSDKLTYSQRIKLEQDLASTIKSINEQSAYDYKTSWEQALTELSNQQINWKDTWVSMMDSIESSISDTLSMTGNFSTRMKSLFKSMGQSILKTLSQVIAKMLMTKLVMSLIGLGSSGKNSIPTVDTIAGGTDATSKAMQSAMYGYFASGGDTPTGKWVMVGERGPELVQFAQDAHVYSNSDTRKMLQQSGGTNQPIQIIVNNNTGQQMQARQTTTQDASGKMLHQIILSTVGEALSTNEMGFRDAIMGVK